MRQAGDLIAGFRIEGLLGSGGMGEVYLVRHPRLPRLDALKLLPATASADPSYRERFLREADLAAQLDHDNVVPVYDRGETDGQLWIHMKYVAGVDAAAALRQGGPFDVRRALHVVTRVAAALDDAHRHDLLHRDVKPANILLGNPAVAGEPERVFLTDFGIAKSAGDAAELTPNGHFAASLDYAAPEQIQLQPLDGRTDQYALGCVLFQLLTGTVPYPGEGAWAKMNAHLTALVPQIGQLRPGLPSAVQTVLDRAMAKAPSDRFASCSAMARAFGEALRGVGVAPLATPVTTDTFPAPRPPDRSETPPPQPGQQPALQGPVLQEPALQELAATAKQPAVSLIKEAIPAGLLPAWWRQVDRGAAAAVVAAVALALLSAFPPTSALSTSRYPAELATGRFAAGQWLAIVLLLVAGGLQLTRSGHRVRPLICAVAAGAGLYAAADSLRVYAFTTSHSGGAYDSALSHTNAALPRALVAVVVALVALASVLRVPPRPKPRPSSHALLALLLACVGVVLAVVAVAVGPAIQRPRVSSIVYGVPLAAAAVAAAVLGLAVLTRRVPLIATAATVALSALVASLVAPDPVRYPVGIAGQLCLLAAAGVLALAARRPPAPPPIAPPPPAWGAAPPAPNVWAAPRPGAGADVAAPPSGFTGMLWPPQARKAQPTYRR